MDINSLSEKIQRDVRRLASYKRTEELGLDPDKFDMVKIMLRTHLNTVVERRHMKDEGGQWLYGSSRLSFDGLLGRYISGENEFLSISTASLGEPVTLGGER
jgi:hypothetical protein